MNNYICNFCNSNLSTSRNLTRHKKESKKCLSIQNMKVECDYCNNCFDKGTAYIHIIKCSKIKLDEKEKEILELKEEKLRLENVINEQHTKYRIIEKELEVYKKIAEQPRTTNTYNDNRRNYYVKFNLSPLNLTDEQIKNTVDDKYDKNYLFDGQKGIADFSYEHFLTNPTTNDVYYAVSDKSRYYFVYKKNDMEYFIDMKGKHFLDRITPHVFNKSQNILEEVKDSDNKIDYFTAFGEIKSCKFGGDITRFTKHLAELCNNKNFKILNGEKKIDEDETVSVITLYTDDDEYEEDENKEDEVYDYVTEYEKVKEYNYDDSYVKMRFIKEHNEKTRIQMEKDGIVSDKYFIKIKRCSC